MKRQRKLSINLVSLAILIVIVAFAGCAAKKNLWGDTETGLILQYRMAKDQPLKYAAEFELTQILDIMGQEMEQVQDKSYTFTITSKSVENNTHQLEVVVDNMVASSASPQGDLKADMSTVIGKSFAMALSLLGKEQNMQEAEAIKYKIGPAERSIISDFQAIFPDLAGSPVKVGETWTTQDTIIEKADDMEIRIKLTSVNTLSGYETLSGMECAKITAEVTGVFEGEGNQGGMDLVFDVDIKADDTWYFAYKEGIVVQTVSIGDGKGTLETSGPQNMSIPVVIETKSGIKLVK